MKKVTTLLILLIVGFCAFSQIEPAKEIALEMSQGKANGWKIFIPKASEKQVNSAYKKWMKDFECKIESVKKSDDLLAPMAKIPFLGESSYNVYSQTQETKEGTYLITFVQMGGAYLNTHQFANESKVWNEKLVEFSTEITKNIIQNELNKKEKVLKESNKTFEKLVSDKEGYEEDIKKAKETIEDRTKKLETNAGEQEKAKVAIGEAEEEVNKVKAELAKYAK